MAFNKPNYKVGFCLNDELQIETEVRAYITDKSYVKDPFGHLDMYHQADLYRGQATTLHLKDYFFKDDNNFIGARQ